MFGYVIELHSKYRQPLLQVICDFCDEEGPLSKQCHVLVFVINFVIQ
jgi:hypothetical protein